MGWMDPPKQPDPKEVAQAQAGMNRDAAVTQQNLNMIDQITPTGSLTYDRTGWTFSPSENGTDIWYNSKTGEYSNAAPPVVGRNVVSTPATPGRITGGQNGTTTQGTPAGTTEEPIYEEGWEQVKGFLDPKWTATTELSPEQQAIFDQTQGASLNLATLANEQSAFLKEHLKKGVDTTGLPALQGSIGSGFSADIGNGFSGDIGGSYRTSMGPDFKTDFGSDYRTKIGGNYSADLGSEYQTSYAGADDFSADRQRYEDAVRQRMAPDLAKTRQATEAQLIGRGLRPGTAAFNSEMDRIQRGENDANIVAILAGGDEQARMVGLARDAADFTNSSLLNRAGFQNQSEMNRFLAENGAVSDQARFGNDAIAGRFAAENAASLAKAGFRNEAAFQGAGFRNDAALTGANFNNSARAQGLQERYAASNDPINKITALLGASQVQNPNFVSTPTTNVQDVPYAGLVAQRYQADAQASQAGMGGLFGLLSSGIGLLSDRRAKTDIHPVGRLDNGLTVYSYRYRGESETQIGLMADEVSKLHPDAVSVGSDGLQRVRYDLAVEAA